MVKHYEWIIKKARGDWISIIGDDDGVVNNFNKGGLHIR